MPVFLWGVEDKEKKRKALAGALLFAAPLFGGNDQSYGLQSPVCKYAQVLLPSICLWVIEGSDWVSQPASSLKSGSALSDDAHTPAG